MTKPNLIAKKGGEETMFVEGYNKQKVNYIIVKIEGKVYSTKFGSAEHEKGCYCSVHNTATKNIGKEKCIMIRDAKLVETNRHEPTEEKNLELDIYFGVEE